MEEIEIIIKPDLILTNFIITDDFFLNYPIHNTVIKIIFEDFVIETEKNNEIIKVINYISKSLKKIKLSTHFVIPESQLILREGNSYIKYLLVQVSW